MHRLTIHLIVALLTFVIGVVVASTWVALHLQSDGESKSQSLHKEAAPNPSLESSIRKVNFANRTYPWPKDMIGSTDPEKTFTLRNGEHPGTCEPKGFKVGASLTQVIYADVTGDGIEDAILYMSAQTCGSAMPELVYVYTLRGNDLKLLWYFSTGDRADGGLHDIYAENGYLIVELNGPELKSEADCCPMRFTRRRYMWRDNRFQQIGREETIPLSTSQ